MKETGFSSLAMSLPYPALVANEEGQVLYRNRLAKKLLPAPHRLRRFLLERAETEKKRFFEASLEGVCYYVGTTQVQNGRYLVCFLESFLPFYEPLSRIILEQMQTFFWDMFPGEDSVHTEGTAKEILDGIAARTFRLRTEEKGYLRLLKMKDRIPGEAVSCSISGFFRHLEQALEKRGIFLSASCPPRAAVKISPDSLSFLILNLVQFVYLFEGEHEIRAAVVQMEEGYRLSFAFSDRNLLFDSLETLFCGKESLDAHLLLAVPLLCAIRLCSEDGVPWILRGEAGQVTFTFSLPAGDRLPDAFLSETMAEEVEELLKTEKEYFS